MSNLPTADPHFTQTDLGYYRVGTNDLSRRCIVCQCSHYSPCMDDQGMTCSWVHPAINVCSACLWFSDSPDAGGPACICSTCRKQIGEDETPLRNWPQPNGANIEARFCEACQVLIFGIRPHDDHEGYFPNEDHEGFFYDPEDLL